MKNLVILSLILINVASYGRPGGHEITFLEQSFAEVKAMAKEQQKPIFVDLYAVWCGPCKYMEKEVFVDREVAEYMNENYLSLRVDAEKEEKALVTMMEIDAYPTMAFFDADGKLIHKQEGIMAGDDFVQLAKGIVNRYQYKADYDRSPKKPENVYNYAISIKWNNPTKARRIVATYLKNTPEKKWIDPQIWRIIRDFVPGSDNVLFTKVLKHKELAQAYPNQYPAYIKLATQDILAKSLDLKSTHHLNRYIKYVRSYGEYHSNPDSLVLVAKILYAQRDDIDQLPGLIKTYVNTYEKENPEALANYAYHLVETHFKREILEMAIDWCKESIQKSNNVLAYITAGLAYEKLNDFKSAYAYILLAESQQNEEWEEVVASHSKRLEEKSRIELNEGVNTIESEKKTDDGRFTLGAGDKRLMYGYPIPSSTSHFVVNVNGELATNSPRLAGKGLTHLKGTLQYGGSGITPEVRITFEFNDVTITQELIPVDKHFNVLTQGLAQYYRVSYLIENKVRRFQKVGLGVLFDTMIDDNDFCSIAADGRILETEEGFLERNMPNELMFYRTRGDSTDMMGAAVLKDHGATAPDKMVIGRWPVLHGVTWDLKPEKAKYGDSAYFLKWENRRLNPEGELEFVTYYGLPGHKKPELRILVEDPNQLTMTANVYFDRGQSRLDLNAKMKINDLLENEDLAITGVLLNGYADVIGEEAYNFNLSQKRIDNVGKIFTAYGVPFVPKPFGNDKSAYGVYNQRFGNTWDRRVEIVIYYRKKSQNLLGQL